MTSENNLKSMLCGYCASVAFDDNSKCRTCEYNPVYHDNFELSKSAELMVGEGVLTRSGAVVMVAKLNSNRYDRIRSVMDNVAEGDYENS